MCESTCGMLASAAHMLAFAPHLCRICLEEDALERLEQPCGCTGTQRHAHHSCIQKWVNEKGNTECEICHQQYKGQYRCVVGMSVQRLALQVAHVCLQVMMQDVQW